MSLAWRVLNFGLRALSAPSHYYELMALVNSVEFLTWPPAEAQAAWLDKILELAVEAGMVEDGV